MEVRIKAEEKDGKTKITTNVNGVCRPISIPAIASGMAKAIISILEDSGMSYTIHYDLLLNSKAMFCNEIYKELGRIDKEHEEKKKADDSDKKDSEGDYLDFLLNIIKGALSMA